MNEFDNLILVSSETCNNIFTKIGLEISKFIDITNFQKKINITQNKYNIKQILVNVATDICKEIHSLYKDRFILGIHKTVLVGHKVLGLVTSEEDALQYIKSLSGRRHTIHITLVLLTPNAKLHFKNIETVVKFKRLSKQEIDFYICNRQWYGCLGGYSLQNFTSIFLKWVRGDFLLEFELPLYHVYCLLSQYFDIRSALIRSVNSDA